MGRSPCCEKAHTNKGAWTPEEDARLIAHIRAHGEGGWRSLPRAAGLLRCGKSCRLRWINYLRPDVKRGNFSEEEDEFIIKLHSSLGNKWSLIARILPGRTDNEIKNYWNTYIKKKLLKRGLDHQFHRPLCSPHNINTIRSSRSAPEHQIPAFQSPRTPEIADFFQYELSGCSPIEPAASKDEEHPDINLDLCISLPLHQPPPQTRLRASMELWIQNLIMTMECAVRQGCKSTMADAETADIQPFLIMRAVSVRGSDYSSEVIYRMDYQLVRDGISHDITVESQASQNQINVTVESQ